MQNLAGGSDVEENTKSLEQNPVGIFFPFKN